MWLPGWLRSAAGGQAGTLGFFRDAMAAWQKIVQPSTQPGRPAGSQGRCPGCSWAHARLGSRPALAPLPQAPTALSKAGLLAGCGSSGCHAGAAREPAVGRNCALTSWSQPAKSCAARSRLAAAVWRALRSWLECVVVGGSIVGTSQQPLTAGIDM